MGKMTQLIKTPDLSRGQKVAVIFIVQALIQPAEVYGAEITKTPIKAKALAYYNFENLKELVVFNDKNE
jgi:type IV secretory pathway TraG/TraD family ATPase VirD4